MSRQQLFVIGLLTGHLGLYGHLHRTGKDINPLYSCLNGNGIIEHLLCGCESPKMSRGRIFGELKQFSHVPVKLFRRFATEIGLAGK